MASDPAPSLPPEAPPLHPAALLDPVYHELEQKIREYRPNEDLSSIEKAYRYAAGFHVGQLRDSGEPYMVHPLAVAKILAGMRMDSVTITTGLLHDVVEDTSVTIEDVRKQFGPEVARCVDGVTKLAKLKFQSSEDRQAENVRKMLLAMVNDIRVIIVKLADRIHNLRTLDFVSRDRQERTARETLEIYAPIANRLGMGKVRGELEDLSFRYLDPEAFAIINREIETKQAVSEKALGEIRKTVETGLRRENIPGRVEGRIKRAYSVYQKIKKQKISIDQVYDLLALRIITDSVKNCYAALGVIHNEWRPVPGRIKDFIAIPRPNLYQSLHTSVIGPDGQPFEVQIRTDEMHRIAEEGIAAHWKYKEGKKGPAEEDQRIAWLRHLVEWQRDMQEPGEFMSTLKVDLYSEEVYTFTPKGRVVVLPVGATPVDFAYAIHSDVGNTCVGAKVNGRIVPLRYGLRNGDSVQILTQPGHQPSKDWLTFVKTSRARNKIKHLINADERNKAIEIGQKYLEKEARRLGVQLSRIPRAEFEKAAADAGMSKVEDLHAAIGYGKLAPRGVLQKVAPDQLEAIEEQSGQALEPAAPPARSPEAPATGRGKPSEYSILVRGAEDILTYLATCCKPIRGEAIVGYITRGKGVAVHSKSCPNVENLMFEAERRMDVEWAKTASNSFAVHLVVHTDDRPGLLNQLTSVLTGEATNIRSLEARTETGPLGDGAVIEMTVDIRDKKQLEKLLATMRRISGVRDVERKID